MSPVAYTEIFSGGVQQIQLRTEDRQSRILGAVSSWSGVLEAAIMIMNRIYDNQILLYIFPLMRHTIVVCVSSISPMARGCFICVNINLVSVLIDVSNFVLSGGILFKMLGINEMVSCLSSEVLKG